MASAFSRNGPANTERSPNIPEWSHEFFFLSFFFWGTKQERYRNVACRLFLGSIFIRRMFRESSRNVLGEQKLNVPRPFPETKFVCWEVGFVIEQFGGVDCN